MRQPRLSIITPVYNGARFMEFCINNVIRQNCPEAEHIIVDGGSTDATVEIIKRYADSYPHIRYVSEKDNGQADAMNKGIKMARGEILGFLNYDDFYEEGIFGHIIQIFKTLSDPAFLVGNCRVWKEEGGLFFVNRPKYLNLVNLFCGTVITDYYRNVFPVNSSAYFYSASLHKKIGLYLIEQYYGMDADFILQAVQVVKIKYRNETWGNQRLFQGAKTMEIIANGSIVPLLESIIESRRSKLPLPIQRKIAGRKQLISRIRHIKGWIRSCLKGLKMKGTSCKGTP